MANDESGLLHDIAMPHVGGRRFRVARLTAADDHAEIDARLNAAYDELDAAYERGAGPIGIAVVLDPAAVAARPADVFWPDTRLLYAGYRPDGHQVRVRYFHGALCIEPGPEGPLDFDFSRRAEFFALGDDYELHDVDDGTVREADIGALWEREGAVPSGAERDRRLREVRALATTRDGDLVGIGSAYRVHHGELHLDLWAVRVFVASGHRRSNLATQINDRTLDRVTAEPEGAAGLLMEITNEHLRKRLARAVMPTRPFTFIGARVDGSTVFVSYFAGVQAPPPPTG